MIRKLLRFIIIIGVLLLCLYFVLNHLFPMEHKETVEKYSNEYSVDSNLIYAVIKAESNFNKDAVSHAGANGLMQITDETALWISEQLNIENFDVYTLSEPDTNINFGVWYLSYLIDEFESTDLAILAYNAGANKVKSWILENTINRDNIEIENIPYPETKIYLTKVKLYRKIYEILYK